MYAECKVEWNGHANIKEICSSIEVNMLYMSDSDSESMDEPDELSNMSEQAYERTECQVKENTPETAQGEQTMLDGKADMSSAP